MYPDDDFWWQQQDEEMQQREEQLRKELAALNMSLAEIQHEIEKLERLNP
jgi:cell division protein FtsB